MIVKCGCGKVLLRPEKESGNYVILAHPIVITSRGIQATCPKCPSVTLLPIRMAVQASS